MYSRHFQSSSRSVSLAGLLVGDDLLASCFSERMDLAVEQLAGGRHPAVADQGTTGADRVECVAVEHERIRDVEGARLAGHGRSV
jgi:hypothetical protein